jgi:anion-transporting  ArsA/GET3 family ATPase
VSLFDKRLILVCGKGGVGRSTVAAAIASRCAAMGRRTLLFQAGANERVGAYFGRPPLGPDIAPLDRAGRLYGVNTSPAAALAEYGLMILKFKTVYEMVFENRLTKAFLRAIPGLDDYAVLGKAWFHVEESKGGRPVWDTLVFDMPASGHSLSMLRIPWVIVDTVPDGPLTRDARAVQALLRDPARTAAVLVTLAEEMPANEARELEASLGQLGITVQQAVVNQIYPDRFPAAAPATRILDALATAPGPVPGPLAALVRASELVRGRRALNRRYVDELATGLRAPKALLPMLFVPELGPAQITELASLLEPVPA